jgi:hypothetical protein
MRAPISQLESRLVLLDIPERRGSVPASAALTSWFVRYTEATLFVMSAFDPLGPFGVLLEASAE